MVLNRARCVRHDALKDLTKTHYSYFKICLFENFAAHSVFHPFPGLNGSSGKAPPALQRLVASLHQQYKISIKYQRPDTKDGLGWIAPDIGLHHYSLTAPLIFILARYTLVFAVM